jgi:lipoate-protein ligase A
MQALVQAGVAPAFARIEWFDAPLPEGAPEIDWLDAAVAGRNTAAFWQAPECLVVPLSYRKHALLDAVCAQSAERGIPVRMRRSGGGVVPMGAGVFGLSLAYAVEGQPGDLSEAVYLHLCGVLMHALGALAITSHTSAVPGAFCDGRFNLAVDTGQGLRKLAGTAQYWRGTGEHPAVLAHAVLLVNCDVEALTSRANAFEAALGSERRYAPDALTTVAQAWQMAHPDATPPADLSQLLARHMLAALA